MHSKDNIMFHSNCLHSAVWIPGFFLRLWYIEKSTCGVRSRNPLHSEKRNARSKYSLQLITCCKGCSLNSIFTVNTCLNLFRNIISLVSISYIMWNVLVHVISECSAAINLIKCCSVICPIINHFSSEIRSIDYP